MSIPIKTQTFQMPTDSWSITSKVQWQPVMGGTELQLVNNFAELDFKAFSVLVKAMKEAKTEPTRIKQATAIFDILIKYVSAKNFKEQLIFSSICNTYYKYINVTDFIDKFLAVGKVYKAGETGMGLKFIIASPVQLVEVV